MRRTIRSLSLPFLLATVALTVANPASADSKGATGRVVELTINESSSSDFSLFHGKVVIKANGENGRETTYMWGGSRCPGRNLSDANVDRLLEAFENRGNTRIVPGFKNGTGGAKCLTSMRIMGKGRAKNSGGGPS